MSAARIFISCGQSKKSDEIEVAKAISDRLRGRGFDPYIAVQEQTLQGLKENIFGRLRKSQYFVFVDFKREKLGRSQHCRGSLFSHQELAMASLLEIDVAAFQERGVKPLDGLIQLLQVNAVEFTDKNLLPNAVADIIEERGWTPNWRNELVLEASPPVDAVGAKCFHVRVRNRHREKLALNCSGYLESITRLPNTPIGMPDETLECKWAATPLPRVSIPAGRARRFDALQIRYAEPLSVVFPILTDSPEYMPRIPQAVGEYELSYLVTSDNFPTAQARFILDLRNSVADTTFTPAPA